MVLGFEMAVKRLPELQKDCPSAHSVLKLILSHCHEAGCWPKDDLEGMSDEFIALLGLKGAKAETMAADADAEAGADVLGDAEKQALANKLVGQSLRGEELLAYYKENKADFNGAFDSKRNICLFCSPYLTFFTKLHLFLLLQALAKWISMRVAEILFNPACIDS